MTVFLLLFVNFGTLRLDFLPNEISDFCFFAIILFKGLVILGLVSEIKLLEFKDKALSLTSEKKSLELSEVEKSPLLDFLGSANKIGFSMADIGACLSSLVIVVILICDCIRVGGCKPLSLSNTSILFF